jgi:hypothetical protein
MVFRRPCEPRPAQGDACHRAPPHGGARRPCRTLRERGGGHTLIAYNSCRNRHYLKCRAAASRRWLADREAELLPGPYFHVVITLRSKLRNVAYQNRRVVCDLPMKAAAETTLAIAADQKRLGARIGITATRARRRRAAAAPGGGDMRRAKMAMHRPFRPPCRLSYNLHGRTDWSAWRPSSARLTITPCSSRQRVCLRPRRCCTRHRPSARTGWRPSPASRQR